MAHHHYSLIFLSLALVLSFGFATEIKKIPSSKTSSSSPPPEVFCLDNFSDLEKQEWDHDSPNPTLHYAETSADLPPYFQNKLSGNGLFYFDGNDQETFWLVTRENWADGTPTPVFMYIKYYAYLGGAEAQDGGEPEGTYIVPPIVDDGSRRYRLPPTNNFEWREELIELSTTSSAAFQVYLNYFRANDYFVIDNIILSKGHAVQGVADILNLCAKPSDSVCQGEEYNADPQDCAKFHQCQYNADGSVLQDDVFTCPDFTVWCQRSKRCEFPTVCPCTNSH